MSDGTQDLKREIKRLKQSIKNQRFGLVWLDIPEAFEDDVENKLPILREISDYSISTDDDKPTHLLIEGDNYHSLTCLNYTHKEKIDVIYIDPPYNTGKGDFRYRDKRLLDKYPDGTDVPSDHPFRHSYWLSFMRKRLELAHNLLSDDGVIFISIDDNEFAQLKLLCDDIFGANSFIAMLIHKNNAIKNQANLMSISTEYMLLYKKNKDSLKQVKWRVPKKGASDIVNMYNKLKESGLSLDEIESEIKEMYKRPKYSHLSRWNKVDEKGVFVDSDLSREGGPTDYTIVNPNTGEDCVIPPRGWGKSHEDLLELQENDLIWYGDPDTPPRKKSYIDTDEEVVSDSFLYFDNSIDTRLIKSMFGDLVFENPKPKEMIKYIIQMSSLKDSIILDFFAGSGTTGHAVLELNEEDGGNRQVILATNNENNICTEVCLPRIKMVINGWKDKYGDGEVTDGIGGSIKYYHTDFIGKNSILDITDSDRIELARNANELLAIAENTLFSKKKNDYFQVFSNGNNNSYTCVYFREGLEKFSDFVDEVKNIQGEISIYVFSWGTEQYIGDFDNLSNIKIKTIPQPILEIYKQIYNL